MPVPLCPALTNALSFQRMLQKLNNIYEGLFPVAGYYTNTSVDSLSDNLKTVIGEFAALNTDIYSGELMLQPGCLCS